MPIEARHLRSTSRASFDGADSGLSSESAISTWREIHAALTPIIGRRGVATLYERCLYLSRADYPWLAEVRTAPLAADSFAPLQMAFAEQPVSAVAAANEALLQTFRNLVTNLIGGLLTEQLLRSIGPSEADS